MSADIDVTALEKDLLDWVTEWNEDEPGDEIGLETNLAGGALLDSMGIVALISYLEDQTGKTFSFGTFSADGGVSIRSLIRHCLG